MTPEELQALLTIFATILNTALGGDPGRKVTAPEDIAIAVATAYAKAYGKPIDPSVFTYEAPIEQEGT